jgi:hypothetical protein
MPTTYATLAYSLYHWGLARKRLSEKLTELELALAATAAPLEATLATSDLIEGRLERRALELAKTLRESELALALVHLVDAGVADLEHEARIFAIRSALSLGERRAAQFDIVLGAAGAADAFESFRWAKTQYEHLELQGENQAFRDERIALRAKGFELPVPDAQMLAAAREEVARLRENIDRLRGALQERLSTQRFALTGLSDELACAARDWLGLLVEEEAPHPGEETNAAQEPSAEEHAQGQGEKELA